MQDFQKPLYGLFGWSEGKMLELKSYPLLHQIYAAAIIIEHGKNEFFRGLFEGHEIIASLIGYPNTNKRIDTSVIFPSFTCDEEIKRLIFIDSPSQLINIKGLLNEPVVINLQHNL